MVRFLIKRFIGLIFVIICVTFITFIMAKFAPGDPIRDMLGNHFDKQLYLQLKHESGLDRPWYEQYLSYIGGLAHFDFGISFYTQGQTAWDVLKEGVPVSAELGFWGLLLTLVIGIPVGIFAALKANTWLDTFSMGASLVLFALPSYILGVYAQVIVIWLHNTVGLQWPVAGWGNAWQYSPTDIQSKLIPICVFAAVGIAFFARLARTTMLEVLRQDYVRTARAKGLLENVVIYRHALRNAMIPLITVIGLSIGLLITGAFFIEQIFNVPGIGSQTITSISHRDYPVIQATVILGAVAVVLGNLISDILYGIVDPRIKSS